MNSLEVCMLFAFQVFGDFQKIFLVLITNLTPLWYKKFSLCDLNTSKDFWHMFYGPEYGL